jgi:hypothetical protein
LNHGEDHDEAEDAVDERHRRAIREAQQEPALLRAGLGAGADDRQVDRHHRQHAGREIEGEAADEDDQQDRQRTTPLQHALLRHAGFGVTHELQEIVGGQVASRGALHAETIEGAQHVGVA